MTQPEPFGEKSEKISWHCPVRNENVGKLVSPNPEHCYTNIMAFFVCTTVPELGLDVSVERAVYAEGEGQARPHVVGRHTAA
jgi:hypothetical protein